MGDWRQIEIFCDFLQILGSKLAYCPVTIVALGRWPLFPALRNLFLQQNKQSRGAYLNDVYTERGRGLPKCRGRGSQNPKNCVDVN